MDDFYHLNQSWCSVDILTHFQSSEDVCFPRRGNGSTDKHQFLPWGEPPGSLRHHSRGICALSQWHLPLLDASGVYNWVSSYFFWMFFCGGNSGSAAQQVIEAHWTPSDNFACPRCDCDKCVGVSNLAGSWFHETTWVKWELVLPLGHSQISFMQRFFTFPLDVCCQSQVLSAGRFISSRSKAFTAMMTTIRWVWRWFWTGPKGWSLFKWLRVFRWEPSGASDHYSMYCLWTPMEGGRGAVSNSDCTWWLMAMAEVLHQLVVGLSKQ